jgi:hypothetical protein
MEISKKFIRTETESLDDVEALLQSRVFHVTRLINLPSIMEVGEISTNQDGRLPTTFGFSGNSFFRNRNCVPLFDYRSEASEEIKGFRSRCDPFRPALPPNGPIAILMLHPEAYGSLIPWTKWKEEEAWREMVVPYVEAGFPGPLPLRLVTEIYAVKITEDPTSYGALLRRAELASKQKDAKG